MADLLNIAEHERGRPFLLQHRRILRRLNALIGEREVIRLITVAVHGLNGAGVLVATTARCAYGVRRFLFWYQVRNFLYEPGLLIEVKRAGVRGRLIQLSFRAQPEKAYRILLGVEKTPTAQEVLTQILPRAKAAGVDVSTDSPVAAQLLSAKAGHGDGAHEQ